VATTIGKTANIMGQMNRAMPVTSTLEVVFFGISPFLLSSLLLFKLRTQTHPNALYTRTCAHAHEILYFFIDCSHAQTMRRFQQESLRADMSQEQLDDLMESLDEPEVETEADAEVDKVKPLFLACLSSVPSVFPATVTTCR